MIALTSPIETVFHRIPAGLKLGFLCLFTLFLFLNDAALIRSTAACLVGLLYLSGGMRFAVEGIKHLKPIFFFVAIIAIWHIVTATMGEGIGIVLLLIAAVGMANLVTMTTRLDDMLAVLHWLTWPLRKLGVNTRALELAIAMVIRFTPVLMQKGSALVEAWRSRSPRRPGWRIIVPLVLLAIDDAEHVSEALRARGGVR